MAEHTWITQCPSPESWMEYIMARVRPDEAGCWIWTASLDRHGYGRFRARIDGRRRYLSAHRASWLALRGEIPYPMMPDHLCRNRACCNPDHMELVTNRTNSLRGDHSKAGAPRRLRGCGTHGFADGYRYRQTSGRLRWVCRPCAEDRRRRWAQKVAA